MRSHWTNSARRLPEMSAATVVLVVAAALCTEIAVAQSSSRDPLEVSQSGVGVNERANERSGAIAFGLSAAGTIVPAVAGLKSGITGPDSDLGIALVAPGVIVGPSLGYFYGHCPSVALEGIAFRVGFAAATVVAVQIERMPFDHYGASRQKEEEVSSILYVIGGGILLNQCLADILDCPKTVTARDRKTRDGSPPSSERPVGKKLRLLPVLLADRSVAGIVAYFEWR
jgi:hypothetical protein